MTEFWRWWVVHMWVEGAFEFFIVAVVGITLVSMGLLRRQSAEKAVMFEALFIMGTGVIGVSHHYWWVGQPDIWIPFGSVFSTLELIPLILILFKAFNEYTALSETGETFPYRWAFLFIIAAASGTSSAPACWASSSTSLSSTTSSTARTSPSPTPTP